MSSGLLTVVFCSLLFLYVVAPELNMQRASLVSYLSVRQRAYLVSVTFPFRISLLRRVYTLATVSAQAVRLLNWLEVM